MAEDCMIDFFAQDEMRFKMDESALRDVANKMMNEVGYHDVLGDGGKPADGSAPIGMIEFGSGPSMDFGGADLSEGADFFLM